MKNRLIIIIPVLIIFALIGMSILNQKSSNYKQVEPVKSLMTEKVSIAACPTFHLLLDSLDDDKYQVRPTGSTAQSLDFLASKQVDLVLSGRILKPNESDFKSLVVGESNFSFLSDQEIMIYQSQLEGYQIYTDLGRELVKEVFKIKQVDQVEDVYQYLDKGIVITSWDNTDYLRAKTVHLFDDFGARIKQSRRLNIHYHPDNENLAQDLLPLIK